MALGVVGVASISVWLGMLEQALALIVGKIFLDEISACSLLGLIVDEWLIRPSGTSLLVEQLWNPFATCTCLADVVSVFG